jgi:hypothetical protein
VLLSDSEILRTSSAAAEILSVAIVKFSTPPAISLSVTRICSEAFSCCWMISEISFALPAVISAKSLILSNFSSRPRAFS